VSFSLSATFPFSLFGRAFEVDQTRSLLAQVTPESTKNSVNAIRHDNESHVSRTVCRVVERSSVRFKILMDT